MSKIISLTPVYDRSRVVQDWKCSRSRYWNYEYAGRGIVPQTTSLALHTGITIHDALAAVGYAYRDGKSISHDDLAVLAFRQMKDALWNEGSSEEVYTFAMEQASLVEGLIRGFLKHVWPRLIEAYPIVIGVEQEVSYAHDGLRFMSKPDLILANEEGEGVYFEYKSTSSKKEAWVNSWRTAVQLHSGVKAVEQTLGKKLERVIVQGLYKGYESYGKQNSVFCYGWRKAGQPPFDKGEISYEYKPRPFVKVPTWEMPGGVKQWVEDMPEVVLADQFPQTPPIEINEDLVEAFFKQRAMREIEIAGAMDGIMNADEEEVEHLLNLVFPQKFDQCVPSFGYECPYKILCHGPQNLDPLSRGFEWRDPHHEPETEILRARGVID